jgi:hypothetical protein
MKIKFELKSFKDKVLILPREEVAWTINSKTLTFKLGWLYWDIRLHFDF